MRVIGGSLELTEPKCGSQTTSFIHCLGSSITVAIVIAICCEIGSGIIAVNTWDSVVLIHRNKINAARQWCGYHATPTLHHRGSRFISLGTALSVGKHCLRLIKVRSRWFPAPRPARRRRFALFLKDRVKHVPQGRTYYWSTF